MNGFLILLVIVLQVFFLAPAGGADDLKTALALNKQGEALLATSKFSEAAGAFEKMLTSCGDHEFCRGVATFYLGKTHSETGQFQKALEHYGKSGLIFENLGKKPNLGSNLLAQGNAYAGLSNYPKALECFLEAEKLLAQSGDTGELFALHNGRAVVKAYMGEYDEALESLTQAEKTLAAPADTRAKAALSLNKGLVREKRRQYDSAAALYKEAVSLFESVGDVKATAVAMINLAQVYEAKSQYQDALDDQTRALELARRVGDRWTESLALNNMGLTQFRRGDFRESLKALDEARVMREDLGMKHFAAETLNNIGLVRLTLADYPKALECFRTARDQCDRAGSPSGEAWALHNLAFVLKDMGRFKESLDASQEAVGIAIRIGDRRLHATALLRLGNLYECQGWFDKAGENYQHAAETQKQISDWNFRANTLADLAALSGAQGDPQGAEGLYKEALELKANIGAPTSGLLCKMALFHIEAHRYEAFRETETSNPAREREASLKRAADYLAQAEKALSPLAKSDLMLLTYVKGRFAADKDPQAAEAEFNKLTGMASASGVGKYQFLASVGLGLAYEAQGRLDRAERAFRDAVTYAERIRQTLDPYTRMTFLDGEVIFGMKHVVAYEGLARVLMRKGDHEAAFTATEFTKARAFAESLALRGPEASHDAPAEVIQRDQVLTRKVGGLLKSLETAREHGASDAAERVGAELAEAVKELDTHVETLRAAHPLFAAVRHPEPMRLGHTELTDDEYALVYDVTDLGLLTFLLHGKKLVSASFNPVPRQRVDELVLKFRRPLEITEADDAADKLAEFDLVTGKQLADMLLGDALEHIPAGARVLIVPDDALGVLPYEALALNDGGKVEESGYMPKITGVEFFGDRNRVSYAHSVTALTLARECNKGKIYPREALVTADPVFNQRDARAGSVQPVAVAQADKDFSVNLMNALEKAMGGFSFGRLPGTGKFAEKFSAMYDGRLVMRTGLDATKRRVMEDFGPSAASYRSVVFGTHGFFSRDIPALKEPVLVLTMVPAGTDGLLRMSEVTGLKVESDVVALMACETGLGRRISGEGTMGMGRAFQHAGAKSVIMSLWSVSEEASVRLFEAFFRNMKDGKEKLEALSLARQEIRRVGFDHPFFWAPFILVGEAQ